MRLAVALILFIVLVVVPIIGVVGYIVMTAAKPIWDEHRQKEIPWWPRAIIWALMLAGTAADYTYNHTIAVLGFHEGAHERMLTHRLQRYRKLPDHDPRKVRAIRNWSWLNLFQAGHW